MHVPGIGWVRCLHNGFYEPYAQPDKRNAAAARAARSAFEALIDGKTAATGEPAEVAS